MNIRTVMDEDFDVIPSTEWMNEGLITLEKIKTGAKSPEQALELGLSERALLLRLSLMVSSILITQHLIYLYP